MPVQAYEITELLALLRCVLKTKGEEHMANEADNMIARIEVEGCQS